jgi:hypothetical protein
MMANGITNLRNPLDERLSQVFTPSADTQKVTGQQSLTESIARGTRAEQVLPEVISTGAAQERAAVEGLMRQRTEGAQRVGELGRQQAKDTAAFEEKFQAMRPAPIEFVPSQENIGDLQSIMAQMVLIGGLIGGSSKRSGIAGLKAIKGMLDGYKQGRKDIFDREKLIYEKALDTQRNEITRIKDLYESQLRARTAGNTAEANALNAELNALTQNGTANIDLVRGDTKRVVDTLNYAMTAKERANTLQEQIRSREEMAREARRAADERAREQRQFQLQLAELKNTGKIQSLPGPVEKRLENLGSVKDSLGRISSTGKPEYFGLFPQKEIAETFLTLVDRGLPVGEIASQVAGAFGTKLPPVTNDTVNWWKDYREFVAKVRNTLFGQTLTKPEERSFDQFTINPTTSADNAKMYFDRQLEIINNAANRQRQIGGSLGINQQTLDAYLGAALPAATKPQGDGTPGNPIKLD